MESPLLDPLDVLRDLIQVLDELRLPYSVGGSFASGIYGEFRATQDIDLVVDFRNVQATEFVQRAKTSFFVDDVSVPQAISEAQSFNIFHRSTAFKVDIFPKLGEFEQQQLNRAVEIKAYGADLKVRVTSAEDCILAKLRWYKSGGCTSERQWNDLLGVVRLQQERLDGAYLEEWAKKLEVADLLERLRADEKQRR